jgi:ABC-type branched-subunit amino acid transport system substrate-binding protein
VKDDAYDPAKTLKVAAELVDGKVFALLGGNGTAELSRGQGLHRK